MIFYIFQRDQKIFENLIDLKLKLILTEKLFKIRYFLNPIDKISI